MIAAVTEFLFGNTEQAVRIDRPNLRANRAGTRGFRAPEVLFKCMDQTIGVFFFVSGFRTTNI